MTTEHDFTPGRWAICLKPSPYLWEFSPRLTAVQIESDTPKLIKGKNGINHYGSQIEKDYVLMVVENGVAAQSIVQKAEGINGEMERRYTAAHEWAKSEVRKLVEIAQ